MAAGCSDVGVLFEFGRGVPKDDVRAAAYYGRACEAKFATGL